MPIASAMSASTSGFHGFGAVVEEAPLVLDDAGGDLEQRLVRDWTLFRNQRFLEIVLQELIVGRESARRTIAA